MSADPSDMPDSFIPQWMTRLCRCGHVDSAHSGPCTGKLVATTDRAPEDCLCVRFHRRDVPDRSSALRGPWDTRRDARRVAA